MKLFSFLFDLNDFSFLIPDLNVMTSAVWPGFHFTIVRVGEEKHIQAILPVIV